MRPLAIDWPFAYSRKPIYLAQTLLYGGLTALDDAPFAQLLLPALLGQWGAIAHQEAYLAHYFGPAYAAYPGQGPALAANQPLPK